MKISTVIAATLHTLRHDRTPLEEASDSDLRHRFDSNGDAEAFAEVVRRHGPVVRNTCQRWLAGPADVDDVFQAPFLVLARRPKTGRRPEALPILAIRENPHARRIYSRQRGVTKPRKDGNPKA